MMDALFCQRVVEGMVKTCGADDDSPIQIVLDLIESNNKNGEFPTWMGVSDYIFNTYRQLKIDDEVEFVDQKQTRKAKIYEIIDHRLSEYVDTKAKYEALIHELIEFESFVLPSKTFKQQFWFRFFAYMLFDEKYTKYLA